MRRLPKNAPHDICIFMCSYGEMYYYFILTAVRTLIILSMMTGVPVRDGTLGGVLILTSWVGFWTSSGLHMKTGSSSLMGYGALICGGVGAVGGTSPRSSVRGAWIASSSSGGASWTPLIAAVRCAVASRILSVAMMVGTGMACWQNWNVSVMRSPAVSAIKTQMQRYWLVEWERF
jgi:hypothetical protein